MKENIKMVALFAFALLALTGCGKVGGPFSPLINPPVFSNFDDGTIQGWAFDYSSPVVVGSPPPLTVTSEPAFQGSDSLEINIPNTSGGMTLTSYSVHVQFSSPVDLTNKTLSMWVYLKSGLVSAPQQVGGQLFIKDNGTFHYANGTFANLVPNQWVQVTYNVNAPNYQDPTPPDVASVIQAGLQISGAGSVSFTSPGVVDADSFGF